MEEDFLTQALARLAQQSKNIKYKTDPSMWAKDVLSIDLWSKQKEIAESVIENKKTAVKSCHAIGKTYTIAMLACWWVCTRWEDDAIVVSTAPTAEQVTKLLWEQIRKHHQNFDLPGRVTQTNEWKDEDGNVVAFGRKPADTNIHGFHGVHRPGGVLVLVDEGCGVHQSIFTGVEAITTGKNDRIVTVGNPDEANTEFGRIFLKEDPGWNKITVSAFDTPAWTGEKVAQVVKDNLIQPDWVEDKRTSWGEGSPRWKSKIEGEFSTDSSNTLFTLGTVNRGKSTEIPENMDEPLVLGVDIARMGDDESVVYANRGGHVRLLDKWSNSPITETARRIHSLAMEHRATEVRIDGVGVGAGVYDVLNELNAEQVYTTVSLVGNAASPDLDRWRNARAYWWDTVREQMAKGEIDISFDDITLEDELLTVEYHFKNQRSSLQVESKEELRSRNGKSPDYADAFIYAAIDLGFDPSDPTNQHTPGEEFEYDLEQLFEDMAYGQGRSPF